MFEEDAKDFHGAAEETRENDDPAVNLAGFFRKGSVALTSEPSY
jgi:hypothetical protein